MPSPSSLEPDLVRQFHIVTGDTDDGSFSVSPFWLYWTASTTSTVGNGITSVALPLIALTLLNVSNFEMGVLTAASYAPVVLMGLPAGLIVQRYELRRLQICMDSFRALVMCTIPLALWMDILTLPHMLLAAFLVGTAGTLFDVANLTFLPRIIPKDELISRNGILHGSVSAAELTGPALGGLLLQAIGAAAAITVDTVTYLVSAVTLWRIPLTGHSPRTADTNFHQQITEGLRYVMQHPIIRPCVLAATAVNFSSGAILASTTPFLIRTLDLPPGAVGLVIAFDGVGSMVGAWLTARTVRRFGSGRTLLLATSIGALLSLAMPLATTPAAVVIFVIGMAGLSAGVTILSVVARTYRQQASPPELLTRVLASVRFISWAAIPLGALSAGAVGQVWDPRAGLAVASVAAFLAPVTIWASRIRGLRELWDYESATES